MRRIRALAVALIVIALWTAVTSAQQPDGCVGVFFDLAGTQLTTAVNSFVPFSFYLMAFNPPGGILAWELSNVMSPQILVTSRSLPSGATDFGAGEENWIVGTGGTCYPENAKKILVTYSALLLAPSTDLTLCLGPANPTTFPGSWGPGYLGCFVPSDLRTFTPCVVNCDEQPRCAVVNPVATYPCTGIEIAAGHRTGTFDSFVDVPITIQRHDFAKAGDVDQLAGMDLTFSWDPAVGSVYAVDLAPVSEGWSMEFNATPGVVRVSMASLAPISTPQVATPLLSLRYQLSSTTGSTPITITSVRAFDLSRRSIATVVMPGMLYVQCDKGDPVDDAEVNSADAILTLQIAAGLYQPSPLELCAADMTNDGTVGAGDAVLVLRRAVGLDSAKATPISVGTVELVAGSQPGEVQLAYQSVAGLEAVLTYNPDMFAFLGASAPGTGGVTITNSNYPGYVQVSFAKPTASDGAVVLRFAGSPPGGTFRLIDARTFDQAGASQAVVVAADELSLVVTAAPERPAAPATLALLPAYPNPFNPSTELRFVLDQPGDARLRIFDVAGRQVRTYSWTALSPGEHAVLWNGRDDAGLAVASGAYVVQLEALGKTQRQSVTLLK